MTLRTGKGGRYRYYTCNSRATEGECGCKGRSIRMERLDTLVVEHLAERIFAPKRLESLLRELLNRNNGKCDDLASEAKCLRKEPHLTEEKIDRLYDALADGLVKDADGFRGSVSKFEQQRDELLRRISGLDRNRDIPKELFSPINISRFSEVLRTRLDDPSAAFRKQYLRLFIDRIEVADEEIRISGSKRALAEGIAKTAKPGNQMVPSFGKDLANHPAHRIVTEFLGNGENCNAVSFKLAAVEFELERIAEKPREAVHHRNVKRTVGAHGVGNELLKLRLLIVCGGPARFDILGDHLPIF